MKSASSKVLFRPNSVLNQTPTSVSLITTIKISTAIFRIMAPANDSGTFPWIIREVWEVQVNLVRKPLQIRLRRADLTFSAKRACHVTIGSRRELKTYAVMKKAEDILMIHKEESLVRRSFSFPVADVRTGGN